ncbi:anti-sigma-D factor RsdA [Virgisporangium aurantiacum]|nr:anti-sigma-D factor RsdA [Virgisporangium aurantiacum]
MSTRRDDANLDLTVIAADDALLDALGRGDPAPDDDKLAGVLAAWRTDLDADQPTDFDMTAMLAELANTEPADAGPVDAAEPADGTTLAGVADLAAELGGGAGTVSELKPAGAGVADGAGVPVRPVPAGRPRRWRPGPRVRRYVTGMAAAGLLIGGLAVGAGQAGPESPLWPIARVLYPERSDLRLAEHTIGLAREAAATGRYADARRTLDKAADEVERVDDPELASRLRAQIEEIRRTLPPTDAERDNPVTPTPSAPTSAPPTTAPATPPGGGVPAVPGVPGQPGGGGTNPDPPVEDIIPDVPDIPVPTLPIPIPIPTLPAPALPLGLVP